MLSDNLPDKASQPLASHANEQDLHKLLRQSWPSGIINGTSSWTLLQQSTSISNSEMYCFDLATASH
jgi:hypothetical protein